MSRTSANKAMATIAGISALALVIASCSSSSSPQQLCVLIRPRRRGVIPGGTGRFRLRSSARRFRLGRCSGSASGSAAAPASSGGAASSGSAGAAAGMNDDATWCDYLKKTYPGISGKTVSGYGSIAAPEANQLKAFLGRTSPPAPA